MEMEVSLEYWNHLASQSILICSLFSGFSIAVLANLIVYDVENRFVDYTLKAAAIAAGSFLVSVFAFTDLLMMTSPGYPMKLVDGDLMFPRIVGVISLMIGIII